MDIKVEPLNPKLLVSRSGAATQGLRDAVETIRENVQYHKKLLKLATFKLPDEERQAHAVRQSLRDYYGPDATIEGLTFSIATALDNSEQYVGVFFDPEKIEEGALEIWLDEKKAKAKAVQGRRSAVEAFVQGVGDMEQLVKAWESNGGDTDRLGAAIERAKERLASS